MVNAISIALSGLQAATKQLNASASNIANLQTVGSLEAGGQEPYSPLTTRQNTQIDSDGNVLGVKSEVIPRNTPFVPSFDPDSPFANEEGIIGVPNIDLATESVNVKLASLTFKANLEVIEAQEELSDELLKIFDEDA